MSASGLDRYFDSISDLGSTDEPMYDVEALGEEFVEEVSAVMGEASFSDVTLECDDGVTIPAHRVLLAARSTVFKTMLEDKKCVEGNTKIHDYPSEAVKLMVFFIYGDFNALAHYDGDDETLLALFSAAEQYRLPGLQDICESVMIQSINSSNVIEFYLVGINSNRDELKKAAMKCIFKNFSEVEKTAGWKEFAKNHPRSIYDLLTFACKKNMRA
jgi:speckle-type POZ protein